MIVVGNSDSFLPDMDKMVTQSSLEAFVNAVLDMVVYWNRENASHFQEIDL